MPDSESEQESISEEAPLITEGAAKRLERQDCHVSFGLGSLESLVTLVGVLLGEGGSRAARGKGLSGNERGRGCLATAVFLLSLHAEGEGGSFGERKT